MQAEHENQQLGKLILIKLKAYIHERERIAFDEEAQKSIGSGEPLSMEVMNAAHEIDELILAYESIHKDFYKYYK